MQAEVRNRLGSGDTLVYVPGIDGTGDYLLGTEERLAEHFDLVTLRYTTEEEGNTHADLAASIARCMAELQLGPALVLAESFGVAVALQLALDYPEQVRGLMLVNGFARFDRRARLAISRAFAPLVTPVMFNLSRPIAARIGLFGDRRDDGALETFLEMKSGVIDAGYRDRLAMIQRVDLLPRLESLEQPVSIFVSDRDKVVPSISSGRKMYQLLPLASLEVLEGAGHIVLPLESEPWVERMLDLGRRAARASSQRDL
ncbi:MAG: pimeloyl-ACP methyl ester carboxylesterase [Planctomycetota bacterium]|jgi:pimeloyl-ACP methyl ester carboxylesterase